MKCCKIGTSMCLHLTAEITTFCPYFQSIYWGCLFRVFITPRPHLFVEAKLCSDEVHAFNFLRVVIL